MNAMKGWHDMTDGVVNLDYLDTAVLRADVTAFANLLRRRAICRPAKTLSVDAASAP